MAPLVSLFPGIIKSTRLNEIEAECRALVYIVLGHVKNRESKVFLRLG